MSQSPLFTTELDVRWGDLDAFNHVNNALYLDYIQEARLRWLTALPPGWFDEAVHPVVVNTTCNYRHPIEWPARLRIELEVIKLGERSLTIGHRIVDANDPERLHGDGHVVLVWIARASGEAIALPRVIAEALRQAD